MMHGNSNVKFTVNSTHNAMETDVKCFPFQAVLFKTGTYFHKFFINSKFYPELFLGYGNNSQFVHFHYTFL
jgi:hypothetical protein